MFVQTEMNLLFHKLFFSFSVQEQSMFEEQKIQDS